MPRRLRYALAAPALLLLGACAEDAPLDSLDPAGPYARMIDDLVDPVFWIAAIVFFGVQIGTLAIAWHFRRRPGDDELPTQTHGNFKLEIGWTIAPAVLLAVIAVFTVSTLLKLDDNEASASELDGMEITIYGHQWWWSFEYELGDGDDAPEIITANELVIPAGVPITVNLESRDVIHSFWVPALNGTRDAVPGRTHTLVLEADEPGEFYGQCKEFCGLSHANMKMRVVALSMPEFQTWLEQQQQPAPMLAQGEPGYEGQQIFIAKCTSCHQINGLEDAEGNPILVEGNAALVARHAPNLTHLMSRETYAGALFELYDPETGEFDRDQLEAWLQDPPGEKPMYSTPREGEVARGMPNLELTPEEIDALVEYLITLGPQAPSPAGPTPTVNNEDDD